MDRIATLPTIAGCVTLAVVDFDAWKRAFDDRARRREEAGILGHHLLRDADDRDLVNVLLRASDRGKLERFLLNEYFTVRPRALGIAAARSVRMLVPQEDQAVRGRTLAAAMASLEVESYDRWKTVFDAEPETRRRAGIVGHAVHRSASDAREVVVYVQAEAAERLRAFFASSELETSMRKAGVCSPPRVRFFEDTSMQDRNDDERYPELAHLRVEPLLAPP